MRTQPSGTSFEDGEEGNEPKKVVSFQVVEKSRKQILFESIHSGISLLGDGWL